MIEPTTILTAEFRPIETRGKKRASPIVEMDASERALLQHHLLSLQTADDPEMGYWGSNDVNDQVEDLLISSGHLFAQIGFHRRRIQ